MRLIAVLALVAILAGCTQSIPLALGERLTKPIFGIAVEDAKTSKALIDQHLAAGSITPMRASQLAACPDAALALDAFRQRAFAPEPEGRKALIYAAVAFALAQEQQGEVKGLVANFMGACSALLPVEKLLGL